MKKIISLLLVATMLVVSLSLTSCEKEETANDKKNTPITENETPDAPETPEEVETPAEPEAPEAPVQLSPAELVNGAIKNTLGAGSYEAKVYKSLDTDIMGNKTSSWLDVVAKASGTNASVEGKKSDYGYEFSHNYYYDGSWMYYDMYDSKFKIQASIEEFAAESGGVAGAIVELPTEAFTNAVVTDNGNDKVVELSVDEATMKAVYRTAIVGIVYDIVGDMIDTVAVNDAKIKITVNNGFVKAFNLSFALEYVIGNDRAAFDFNQNIDFVNAGQPVTVNLPANLDDYMEMDWG